MLSKYGDKSPMYTPSTKLQFNITKQHIWKTTGLKNFNLHHLTQFRISFFV